MGSMLLASFPGASSITTGGSCLRSKRYAKNYYASSYVTTLWHKKGKIQKEHRAVIFSKHNLKQHYKVNEGGSTSNTSKTCEKKYVVNAISEQSFEYEPQARDPESIWGSVNDALDTFYKFCRPYAMFNVVLGATFKSLVAVEKLSDLSLAFFIGWLQVVVAVICSHIFGVGLNQLCDIEIDKINKPDLPLASGKLSFRNVVIITASSLILGLGFAWIVDSWPLFWTVFISCMVASAYNVDLPLLRWKKYPVLTAINFIADVAVTRSLGFFLHMQTCVFKRPTTFPRPLIFCTAIVSIYAIVIALFKDIPDMEGDEKFGIQSLSLRLGPKRVFWICVSLLEMTYGVTILVGATSPILWSKIITVLGHAVLASVLWYHAKSVDLTSNVVLQSFYMFIWKLHTAEYFLIPLFR
uniref:8-dimethylallyltransferase n=1 Tax=Sophora flavescens TaxID=49840 RepID=F8WPJ0_SOPFL|nr:8-dimethylallyltransferase [Sophora flavescens]